MIPKPTRPPKKKKKKLKSLSSLTKEAQVVFNAYIRKRDSEGDWFRCISCGQTLPIKSMQAGHYIAVSRSRFLRFNKNNVSGECQGCNNFNPSHLIGYRANLILKIGSSAVADLEYHDKHRTPHKFTRGELQELIERYK